MGAAFIAQGQADARNYKRLTDPPFFLNVLSEDTLSAMPL